MGTSSLWFHLFWLSFSALSSVSSSNVVEEIHRSQFPGNFLFGTSTSSYQIEGAAYEDGKGLNNWDVFSRIPGGIKDGHNGDVAADHYHRYKEDIDMMSSLGVNAYRFSISWTRILPRGRLGDVNHEGIMFYNKLIDYLLLKGIEPFVTLHHFDIPQELEDNYGSWLSPLMQDDFAYFADICFRSFGDRVKYWVTINESVLYAYLAYFTKLYPPGRYCELLGECSGNPILDPISAVHNMILSHAKATSIYKKHYQPKQGGYIGAVVSAPMYVPYSDEETDHEAAKRALAFKVAWFLDPLIHGDYPREMRRHLGNKMPKFKPEESDQMLKDGLDFIGVNQYTTFYAKDCLNNLSSPQCDVLQGFVHATPENDGGFIGEPTSMPVIYVVPTGMEKMIKYLKERYNNKPMIVTENGYPQENLGIGSQEDLLNDFKRVNYHKSYLSSLARAIKDGADVRGYFAWSLLDNFEWTYGYTLRFGLHHVDFTTLKRTPKLSAKWYTSFLTGNNTNTYINQNSSSDSARATSHAV
ncbi:hypothetical protein Scep_011216 [Stephania cephalantha]|uniref:Beta-glucosidase n=1 Tax=Stephania cephalantha TaxID=152367 RepID=A0AAP0JES2_9MAGN